MTKKAKAICESKPCEVFPDAADAFCFGNNEVPEILRHVLALLKSSRLPQALSFRQKWRSWNSMTCIRLEVVFPAAAGGFLFVPK